jgi:hypothetical protein
MEKNSVPMERNKVIDFEEILPVVAVIARRAVVLLFPPSQGKS